MDKCLSSYSQCLYLSGFERVTDSLQTGLSPSHTWDRTALEQIRQPRAPNAGW